MIRDLGVLVKGYFRRKGYGVQSPFAYRFMREIVVAELPYQIYAELPEREGSGKKRREKEDRFLLRLSNMVQPELLVAVGEVDELTRRYVEAGCRKSVWGEAGKDKRALIVADCRNGSVREEMEERMEEAGEDSVVACVDIRDDGEARRLWRDVKGGTKVVQVFDLWSVGVVFFDKSRSPQVYCAYL